MTRNFWWFCALGPLVSGTAGCSLTYIPAQHSSGRDAGIQPPADAWPARDVRGLLRIKAQKDLQLALMPSAGSGPLDMLMTVEGLPYGQGWIQQVEFGTRDGPLATGPMTFEYLCWHQGEAPPPLEAVSQGQALLVPELRAKLLDTADYHQAFTLLLPDHGEPVGLVIHAFSLSSGRNELAVTDELRRRGWAILRTTQLSFQSGNTPKRERTPQVESAPKPPPEVQIQSLTRALESLLADYAYAEEAAVMFALDRRPVLRGKPIAVVGFSMGAILAPTVAARLGDQVAGVALIGGGADLLGIVTESPVIWWLGGISSLRSKLGSTRFAEIDREYRESVVLDPYTTVVGLRNTPVLMVHAAWDSIVPAKYGDLLWERAGRPERWIFSGGHIPLFWNIDRYSLQIADWMDGAVAASRTADVRLGESQPSR